MDRNLFRYVWRWSKRDQIAIFAIVLASLPFYYVSLDLPRKIVNEAIQGRAFENGRRTAPFLNLSLHWPDVLGGGDLIIFKGFELERLPLLLGLSFLFLFFVLINGFFKYWINVSKGALGERMMRRLRFELFSLALRFSPDALKSIRSTEAATIIKDEVEPIGGFIGDAFIQPVFLGTQAATALFFIFMQSVWLGFVAAAVVGVQFTVIPRMRRELLRLGRMRQIASRKFAGRVGEVIDGIEAVHVHNTGAWERAEIGGRLHELFDIRFRIYRRKFIVKFMNNLLAQMTPFFFFAIGGYFALSGQLNIGQLVAVIAAYRELPPPLKELIDWDQQRLDVQVKYEQVVQYFAADRLLPAEGEESEAAAEPLSGPLAVSDLQVVDGHGRPVIEDGNLEIPLPARIALLSDDGAGAAALARIIARRQTGYAGEVRFGGQPVSALSAGQVGRRLAYAGPEPVLFPGSLRDNLLYGLRQRQVAAAAAQDAAEALRVAEAKRTGNPIEAVSAEWVDLEIAGAADPASLDAELLELLDRFGMSEDVYRFGLTGMIDPDRQPALAERIVEARERLRDKLREQGMADLVEPFDPERYNTQATVAENLLFGVPVSKRLVGRAVTEHPAFRAVLDDEELTEEFVRMGLAIADTMTDIFRGLPSGHPLFDQFSFVHAEDLPEFESILARSRVRGRGGLTREDRERLLALPLAYSEPRHRLGLLDEALQERLLAARKAMRAMLEARDEPLVAFYDPAEVNPAAPVRDNLLFGRVDNRSADAAERVKNVGAALIREMDLVGDIERVGLDHQVGPAGRLLTAPQRAAVNLIRCLVKRPDVLVLDGALAPFGEERAADLLALLAERSAGRTLLAVLPNERHAHLFDALVRVAGGTLRPEEPPARSSPEDGGPARAEEPPPVGEAEDAAGPEETDRLPKVAAE